MAFSCGKPFIWLCGSISMRPPSEIDVVFVSPLYGATGGVTSWTQKLVEQGLPEGYRMYIVDTGIHDKRRIPDLSSWRGEGRRTLRIIASVLWNYATVRPSIAHINYGVNPDHKLGMLRSLVCAILARIWGIPVVGHYHGDIYRVAGGRKSVIGWWLLRMLVKVSELNIATNRNSLVFLEDLQRVKQRAPVFLPNYIQDSVFHHHAVRAIGLPSRIKVLYAGWITITKGCREILAAARQLPETDFILLGPVKSDMEFCLDALPANVVLGGDVTPDAVLQQMNSCDLFLFPSYSEGFPNVVLEAMAAGLPVVATRVGAVPEMIEEGTGGLLIDNPDEREIISALRILISNPGMRLRMGRFNRRKSQAEYSYSVIIERLVSLYREILYDT